MNKAVKYGLIVFGLNVVVYVVFIIISTVFFGNNLDVALTILLLVPIIGLLLELGFGIIFVVGQKRKNLGAGLLIGLGITILIGLSVCGFLAAV